MVQIGIERVKTGCRTCKTRKVKCSEERPYCNRCLKTGRKCDGYEQVPIGSFSWSQLLEKRPGLALIQNPVDDISISELRALCFFKRVAAPSLSKPLDSYFWTHAILQLAHHEPATKHALLTISALYEELHHHRHGLKAPSSIGLQHDAVWHYNKAITLTQMTHDRDVVLFMCLMFVCIEILRDNYQEAINHCRHGITMLNEFCPESSLIRKHIEPAFCRLSVFPYFFGASPQTFPLRNIGLLTSWSSGEPFQSAADAHAALNRVLVQTIRLVRSADWYRLDTTSNCELDQDMLDRRYHLDQELDQFFDMFRDLRHRRITSDDYSRSHLLFLVEIQWLVCKVWNAVCFSKEEIAYDEHMDSFRAIVDLGKKAESSIHHGHGATNEGSKPGSFTLEMGFGPLLAFVVIKCRCLSLRLAALELMHSASVAKECGWDLDLLAAMGRRTIEIEHGIKLPEHVRWHDYIDHETILPAEANRIKDSMMFSVPSAGERASRTDTRSQCKITFLLNSSDGEGLTAKDDWLHV